MQTGNRFIAALFLVMMGGLYPAAVRAQQDNGSAPGKPKGDPQAKTPASAPPRDKNGNNGSVGEATGLSRWLDIETVSFSTRYRSVTDTNNVGIFSQNQERSVVDGRFKFDRGGEYSIFTHVSSGRYFNWAYADVGWGNTTGDAYRRAAPGLATNLANVNLADSLNGATQAYIQQNYPTAPASFITQITPSIQTQLRSSVYQQLRDNFVQGLTSETLIPSSSGWNMYVRQLYFDAKPMKGLEFQYGSIAILRGVSTEITSYDDDGYLAGERVSVRKPKMLYFDEISVTFGYLGDIITPNFFRRGGRLAETNYAQYLAQKKFGKRIKASADFTRQSLINTVREAVLVRVPEAKILDNVRVETYQRLNDIYFGPQVYRSGNGYAFTAEKVLKKRYTIDAGISDIDRNYAVLTRAVADDFGGGTAGFGFDDVGFGLNGDSTGLGRRLFLKGTVKLNSYLNLNGFYTQMFNNDPHVYNYIWNQTSGYAGVTIDFKKMASQLMGSRK